MNTQTADGPQEVPFLAGMEREGDPQSVSDLQAATERLGKATFTVHGMATAVRDLLNDVKGMLTGLKNERWNPDAPYTPEPDMDRLVRLTAREAARTAVEIGTYNEGGGNNKPESSWQNRILGIVGLLVVAGVGTTIYQLSELKAQVGTRATVDQMSEVKEQVAAIAATQNASIAATNQRLDAGERRIENLERKVFQ